MRLRFIDSLTFLERSLSQFGTRSIFLYVSLFFDDYDDLPYSNIPEKEFIYTDSWSKLKDTILHNNISYNSMNDKHISDKEYNHIKNVWLLFHFQNLGIYSVSLLGHRCIIVT